MKPEWKDITEYSRDGKARTPRAYKIECGFGIMVHRHITYQDDVWVLSCSALNIFNKILAGIDIVYAQKEAIRYCKTRTMKLYDALAQLEVE